MITNSQVGKGGLPRSSVEVALAKTAGQATLPDLETFKLVTFLGEVKAHPKKSSNKIQSATRRTCQALPHCVMSEPREQSRALPRVAIVPLTTTSGSNCSSP